MKLNSPTADFHAPLISRLKLHRLKVARLRYLGWWTTAGIVCFGVAYQAHLLILMALFPLWVSFRISHDLREMDSQIAGVEQDRIDWLAATAEFDHQLQAARS